VRGIESDFALRWVVHEDVSAKQIQWTVRTHVPSDFLEELVLDQSGLKFVHPFDGVELG
jgi:hypothetical protein